MSQHLDTLKIFEQTMAGILSRFSFFRHRNNNTAAEKHL